MLDTSPYVGFIPVHDTGAARAFYEGTLGLSVLDDSPFALVVDAAGTMLRLTPVPGFTPQNFTVAGWKVTDIVASVRGLAERGVHCTRFDGMDQDELGIWTTSGGDRVAWFADPDGNTLSLTQFAPTDRVQT